MYHYESADIENCAMIGDMYFDFDADIDDEKEFNKDWFISADLSGRFGSNSYSSFQGMLSLEYLF